MTIGLSLAAQPALAADAPHVQKISIEKLCAQMENGDARERVRVLKALATMGPAAAPAVDSIIDVLNDNRSFGAGGNMAQRVSPEVTDAAIDALAKIGPRARSSAPYLIQILADRNELFRRMQVLQALNVIGADGGATKVIMRIAQEEGKSTPARALALQVISKVDPPAVDALDFLKQIAGDSTDAKSKQAALCSIESITARSKKADAEKPTEENTEETELRGQLGSDHCAGERIGALNKIANDGKKWSKLVPRLIQMLNDSDAKVVDATMDALASIGPPASSATPLLITRLLNERSEDIRQTICRTVSEIDPTGKLSIPLLRPALEDPFKARIALQLLDEFRGAASSSLAATTRKRWCIK